MIWGLILLVGSIMAWIGCTWASFVSEHTEPSQRYKRGGYYDHPEKRK